MKRLLFLFVFVSLSLNMLASAHTPPDTLPPAPPQDTALLPIKSELPVTLKDTQRQVLAVDIPKKDTVVSPWKIKGFGKVNISQTAFFNWAAGGDNSVASNLHVNLTASYKQGNWEWDNVFNSDFGLIYSSSDGWQKSVDKIEISSIFGYAHHDKKWYYSALLDFKTQYANGYSSPHDKTYISAIMAPGYLNLGLGMDYKPSANFTAFYSPFTGRFTFVLDDSLSQAGAFGINPGEHVKRQVGMSAKIMAKVKLMENVKATTTLDLFSPYIDTFGNIVVDWDMTIHMKINKYLSATINTSLKYDDKVSTLDKDGNPAGAKVQFKEIVGLGITYAF
jgi:hypothetical protein